MRKVVLGQIMVGRGGVDFALNWRTFVKKLFGKLVCFIIIIYFF